MTLRTHGRLPSVVSELDDQAMATRLAGGDESVLAAMYERWAPQVHTVAFCILGDADEAEDVVEETFWQAWRSAASYDGARAAIPAWLMMIARSRALDALRRRQRMAGRLAAASQAKALADGDEPSVPEPPPAFEFEKREHYARLAAGLAALPPDQREALELAYYAGLSHAEIAVRLAQPLGTVKTRLRLAMQKLRQRLNCPKGRRRG